jgi:FixJ family two-component response regulator
MLAQLAQISSSKPIFIRERHVPTVFIVDEDAPTRESIEHLLEDAGLGISEITVKSHRGRAMRKMAAKFLADILNMARPLRLEASSGQRSATRPSRA